MTYNHGMWDRQEPRLVEARDEKEAAEKVCGGPLTPGYDSPGNLRAKVWPAYTKAALFSALSG
jgi:hypothetical protein